MIPPGGTKPSDAARLLQVFGVVLAVSGAIASVSIAWWLVSAASRAEGEERGYAALGVVEFTIAGVLIGSVALAIVLFVWKGFPILRRVCLISSLVILSSSIATPFCFDLVVRHADARRQEELDAIVARIDADNKAAAIVPDPPMPLRLAGPWEGDDPIRGQGTQSGIFLDIDAVLQIRLSRSAVAAGTTAESRTPPKVRFYQRTSGIEESVLFEAGKVLPNMSSSLVGQRLRAQLQNDRPSGDSPHTVITLDVTFDPAQGVWTGDYTRDGVTKPVRLARPGASMRAQPSPLVGTWRSSEEVTKEGSQRSSCLSIAQGADGAFIAWEPPIGYYWRGKDLPPSTATLEEEAGQQWGITVEDQTLKLEKKTYISAAGGRERNKFVGNFHIVSAGETRIEGKLVDGFARAPQEQAKQTGPVFWWSKASRGCVESLTVVPPLAK